MLGLKLQMPKGVLRPEVQPGDEVQSLGNESGRLDFERRVDEKVPADV